MSCCADVGYEKEEINGECPECGEPTVDGNAYEQCSYSPETCEICNCKPCDLSC
jgi:hypothetical protein